MTHDVTLPAAALAGLLSFLSPCVLPLVPPYLTFIAGTTIEEVATRREARARRGILFAAALFIFGFSTVFVGLGATASAFGQVLHEYFSTLSLLAGVAIIVMGLHFLGVFRFALLYREARVDVQRPPGIWGAYIMGLAFGFGWNSLHWSHSRGDSRGRRVGGDSRQGCSAAGRLFGRDLACRFCWRRSPSNPLSALSSGSGPILGRSSGSLAFCSWRPELPF